MKKNLSALLAAALSLTLLAGCFSKTPETPAPEVPDTPEVDQPVEELPVDPEANVNFAVLAGPTGVGAAWLMENFGVDSGEKLRLDTTVAADNNEISAALVNKDLDIAAVATNLAANLNAKTEGGVQVLCLNTMGVLYILEKGDTVHEMADLRGKTLYAPSNTKGANPEHILNHLLTASGVEPTEVDIQWLTPQEITAKMTTEESGICMLPVPAATAVLVKDAGVREAISLSDAWEQVEGSALPMGCVVARTAFVEEHPELVEEFLTQYGQSITYTLEEGNRAEAAELVAKYAITPNAAIAARAIPQCNLTFTTGQEMKDILESYYRVLFQAAPNSIGGSMPYDAFYYGVE